MCPSIRFSPGAGPLSCGVSCVCCGGVRACCCGGGCGCGCVCVRFFMSCTEKTLLCVRSKRSRVYFQNARVTWDGRFEGTHGSVLNVDTGAF